MKEPVHGRVKSRIAAVLGLDAAVALYRSCILDLLETIEQTGCPLDICVDPAEGIASVSAWLGGHRTYRPQRGADLGERMKQAFHTVFAKNVERAVLIGSDLPDLPVELLQEAMNALDEFGAVIGPARDGGYYLIGFRQDAFNPGIFRGIEWSRADVFERTLQLFRRANTSLHVLPPWQDVDTIGDLRDLMQRNDRTAFAESRTMQYLRTIQDRLAGAEDLHGTI